MQTHGGVPAFEQQRPPQRLGQRSGDWEYEAEQRAACRRLEADAAAVALEVAAYDGQTEAGALVVRRRGEEGLEYLAGDRRRDPAAVVGDPYLDPPV